MKEFRQIEKALDKLLIVAGIAAAALLGGGIWILRLLIR